MIGLEDPFPNDDHHITGSLDDVDQSVYYQAKLVTDLVYQKQRYILSTSPTQIYIPRKEIILKLMRACIEVKQINGLWFNH